MSRLCSIDSVKEIVGETTTERDALLALLVEGVSSRMEKWMGRTIAETTYSSEVHHSVGYESIVLRHGPALSITTVVEGDTTLVAADYRVEGAQSLVRLYSGITSCWATGDVLVTYKAGYKDTPDDLALACAMQAGVEYLDTQASGEFRLGRTGKSPREGESETFAGDGWLPRTIDAMRQYRAL